MSGLAIAGGVCCVCCLCMAAAPTESLMSELRSLPRAYWVLVGGWFVNRFGTFVHPFLTLVLSARGFGPGQVAWVLCANGVGQFASSLLGGYFSDRCGRRNVLVVGTLGNAAAVFTLFFMHELWAIVGMMWCAGFASGFYMPASTALLADVVPPHLRLRAYSGQRLAINAGFACGASAAGFLITVSTFALFVGDALTTALFGVIAFFLLPHGVRAAREEMGWMQAWEHVRRDRAFWGLFVASVLSSFIFQQFNSTFSLEMKQRGLTLDLLGWRLTPEQVFGCVLGWNGIMVALFELPMTRWTQRLDFRRVIKTGYVLMGGGFAMNALHGGAGMLFAAMTLFTIGEMLSQPMRSAYVAQLAPLHMRGRYMGLLTMGTTLAAIFGPHVSLRLHAWSPAVLWVGCGVLGVLSAFTLVGAKRAEV